MELAPHDHGLAQIRQPWTSAKAQQIWISRSAQCADSPPPAGRRRKVRLQSRVYGVIFCERQPVEGMVRFWALGPLAAIRADDIHWRCHYRRVVACTLSPRATRHALCRNTALPVSIYASRPAVGSFDPSWPVERPYGLSTAPPSISITEISHWPTGTAWQQRGTDALITTRSDSSSKALTCDYRCPNMLGQCLDGYP